ncbi:tetratricopeptide repeat protein [Glacieibacterium frigidum]|uniref:Uncharacterized protein n=1 Tax=Glacieibacterium frigidum TaxID=2593303 RepID=A0A552UA58_9SPHN|nr:hypothetical protein [Glacieibacterium frigidum]TRW15104.1 hypothetical protein FMM06_15780 [Glacieibacterium frigidum]
MNRLMLAALLAATVPAAASAAVSVIGGGLGRDCYLAAEAARGARDGLDSCNRALADEALSIGDRAATLVNRGIVKMQAKDLSAAIEDFDVAIRTRPGTAEAYINKGIALIHLGGRDRDAVELLTLGLAKKPTRPEVAYYVRGIANEQLGATREAYEDYARAASLKPDWAEPAEQLSRFSVVRKATAGI